MVLLLWPVELPYYAMSPGPVEDVADLITVTDAETYPSEGTFYLLTVGLREVNVFEWFEARYLDSRVDLLDRDVIRPPGVSQEQVARTNLEAMDESIDTAIFVALERLGYEVTFIGEGVEVLQVVDDTPAAGVIEVGDQFDVIAGQEVSTADQAGEIIRGFEVGDTITLSGTRGGRTSLRGHHACSPSRHRGCSRWSASYSTPSISTSTFLSTCRWIRGTSVVPRQA